MLRISVQTVWKWRSRDDVHNRGHIPHLLQTTLISVQEAVAVALRRAPLLPLSDRLAVMRAVMYLQVARLGFDRDLRRCAIGS